MLKLNLGELLAKVGRTKYWLHQQVTMSYQNFDKMFNNQTRSIKYEIIEQLCKALNCGIADLFIEANE